MITPLSDRQLREIEYHRKRADQLREIIDKPVSWEILENPSVRWWNSAWQMFHHLKKCDIHFNFLVARIVPKGSPWIAKMDRLFLKLVGPVGALLAGRVLLCSRLSSKPPTSAGVSTREFA